MTDSIVNGVAGLIGSVLGYDSQAKANDMNMRINNESLRSAERMQQNANDFTEMMWNKSNEYNTPAAQRARLEAAGFNPYMMMSGQGGSTAQTVTGQGGSVPSSIPMQAYQPDLSGFGDVLSEVLGYSQKREEINALRSDNEYRDTMNYLKVQDAYYDIANKKDKTELDYLKMRFLRSKLKVYEATEQDEINRIKSESALAEEHYQEASWQNFWTKFTSNLQYKLLENDVYLGRAGLKRIQSEVSLNWQKLVNLQTENRLTDKEISSVAEDISAKIAANAHNKKLYPIVRDLTRSEIYRNLRGSGRVSGPFGIGANFNTMDHPTYRESEW